MCSTASAPLTLTSRVTKAENHLYLPQFFKENNAIVELCTQLLTHESFEQYRNEERSLISRRVRLSRYQIKDLMDVMIKDTISTDEKTEHLRKELAKHYKTDVFLKCRSMGELVKKSLVMLLKDSKH
jgi:uncharacterized Fe-S cluster-containing radical SAM superfamily protein